MENLSQSSDRRVQRNQFYLLHSHPPKIKEVNGLVVPSNVSKYEFVYHENTQIIDSTCPKLSMVPIEICKQIVQSLNLEVNPINSMILYEVIFYLLNRQQNQNHYPYEATNRFGQWIMFFEKIKGPEGFDFKWEQCCKFYDEGKLNGIAALMCSTGYIPPESNKKNSNLGVIYFFCGPKENVKKILEYGKHLKQTISYYTAYGFMFYKSFDQFSEAEGGSLYSLPVPKGSPSRFYLFDLSFDSFNITEMIDSNVIPTEIQNARYLYHENGNIVNSKFLKLRHLPFGVCKRLINCINLNIINDDEETKILYEIIYNSLLCRFPDINIYPYKDTNKLGKWMMFYNNKIESIQGFDQKWKKCCKLYDEGKLNGIAAIMCNTGFIPSVHEEYNTDMGVIYFFCGPKNDELKILEIGKNLLRLISYYNSYGYMYYKSFEHSKDGEQSFLYKLSVPKPKDPRRFYLFHSSDSPLEFDELNGNIIPTTILNFKYLLHENMNIVNLKFLKLRKLPLETCKLILKYMNCLNSNDETIDNEERGVLYELVYNYLLYHVPDINIFPYEYTNRFGKWMMFFKKMKNTCGFDQKWKECCQLYDNGKLIGIAALMCSTGFIPSGYEECTSDTGAIFFICGPKDNHTEIMEYGKNLLKYLPYYNRYGYMFYKSYEDCMDGEGKSLCRISVPTGPLSRFYLLNPSTIRLKSNINELDGNVMPTKILNDQFLYYENLRILKCLKLNILPSTVRNKILSCINLNLIYENDKKEFCGILCEVMYNYFLYSRNSSIINLFPYEKTNKLSKWIMFFKKIEGPEGFDKKWEKCCKLYEENKLNGIAALMCTTGFILHEYGDNNSERGAIFFVCGPNDDVSKLLEYGHNLLQLIPYHSPCGNMYYKRFEHCMENEGGILCSIPVPVCPIECTHAAHCRQHSSVTNNSIVILD